MRMVDSGSVWRVLLLTASLLVEVRGVAESFSGSGQSPLPDYTGDFKFNADLYLNYSSVLYDVGTAVSIWSDIAATSAKRMVLNDGAYDPYGMVFLYKRNPLPTNMYDLWLDMGVLLESGIEGDDYGKCLAMNSGLVLVGAPSHSQSGKKTGAAYIHFGDNYQTTVSLFPSSAEEYSYFGSSVAVTPGISHFQGGAIFVGAYGHYHDGDHPNSGMVYVYSKSYSTYLGYTWSLSSKIQPSIIYPNSQFGKSVSSYGNILAVGAPGIDKVFIFNLENHEDHEQREHEREEQRMREEEQYQKHLEEEEREYEEQEREREELEREQEREREEDNREYDREHGREEEHHRSLRRALQNHDREDEDREREERERNEHDHEDSNVVRSEWGYYEILVVTSNHYPDDDESEDPEHTRVLDFGCAVSVTNETLLSVAIGASNDGVTMATGGAYVLSMARKQDVYSGFHSNHRKLRNNNKNHYYYNDYYYYGRNGDDTDDSGDDYGPDYTDTPLWNLYTDQYNSDYEGNFWVLETAAFGTYGDERFGSSVSISGGVAAFGDGGASYTGKVEVYARVPCGSGCDYFFKDIVLRGPLYNSQWISSSTIYDSDAADQNTFGSAVDVDVDTVIIGSSLMNYGTGSVYIYSTRSLVFAKRDDVDDTYYAPWVEPEPVDEDDVGDTSYTDTTNTTWYDRSEPNEEGEGAGSSIIDSESDVDIDQVDDTFNFSLMDIIRDLWNSEYFLPTISGLAILGAVMALYAKIRYHFLKPKVKKKKKSKSQGFSLNDLDSSTNSTNGLLDTSISSVQMMPHYSSHFNPPPPLPRSHGRGVAGSRGGPNGRQASRQLPPTTQRGYPNRSSQQTV